MARIVERRLRRGLAAVEAALVMPLLLLLVLGLLQFGWIFLRTQQITHAARHGARVGATVDATNGDIADAVAAWCGNEAVLINPCNVDIDVDVAALAPGELLTVTVTSTDIKLWEDSLVPTPDSFSATMVMAKEGP